MSVSPAGVQAIRRSARRRDARPRASTESSKPPWSPSPAGGLLGELVLTFDDAEGSFRRELDDRVTA